MSATSLLNLEPIVLAPKTEFSAICSKDINFEACGCGSANGGGAGGCCDCGTENGSGS